MDGSHAEEGTQAFSIHDEIATIRDISHQEILSAGESDSLESFILPATRGNKKRKVQEPVRAGPSSGSVEFIDLTLSESDEEATHHTDGSRAAEPGSSAHSTTGPLVSIANSTSLGEYLCPICYSSPKNATATPCGHVCCGECLFTAVAAALRRACPAGRVHEPSIAT